MPEKKHNLDEKAMSLQEHLEELRRRLLIAAGAVGIGFGACYYFSKDMFTLLMVPLVKALPPGSSLIFTGVTEAFFTYMKVALLAGVFLCSPLIFYEIWAFVAPGLYVREKRYMIPFVAFSGVLFVGGALFGYFIVFPNAFRYLLGFASDYIRPFPSMREYFSLAWKLLLAFGIVFEMPLVVFSLARMGLVTAELMTKKFRYAFLLIVVVAAIVTPTPDVINLGLMTAPMLALYGISIIIAKIWGKKPRQAVGGD